MIYMMKYKSFSFKQLKVTVVKKPHNQINNRGFSAGDSGSSPEWRENLRFRSVATTFIPPLLPPNAVMLNSFSAPPSNTGFSITFMIDKYLSQRLFYFGRGVPDQVRNDGKYEVAPPWPNNHHPLNIPKRRHADLVSAFPSFQSLNAYTHFLQRLLRRLVLQ